MRTLFPVIYPENCTELEEFVKANETHRCERSCSGDTPAECETTRELSYCACKPGYARRTPTRECVPEEECLKDPCPGPHELRKHYGFGDLCRPTCKRRSRLCGEKSDYFNVTFACECEQGYILKDYNSHCIPIEQCEMTDGVSGGRIATNTDPSRVSVTTGDESSNEPRNPESQSIGTSEEDEE
ncbi:hypothetical protein Y032_0006g3051 [Ancylostoma ceylanicum]|uniref:TIL domain-containing protein n=1 Tax=Ancylostoma ceylanicum TaxID=53326 RepID=A0A016VQC2_9BILA|nr:hypothetical protein Y032_0006g3051 [Ancylostoma ceylanicum]